jgi:glycosyltransferase involved in cell wall biosynthesis
VLVAFGARAAADWSAAGARAVEVISHGSDPPTPGAVPPSAGESVLFAGFIGPSKGLDVLLAAWGEVGAGLGLPLLVAGAAPPPHDAWLDGLLAALPAGPSPPRLLGPVAGEAAFQDLIARAAIVVAPYRSSSPASGVIARAMGAGRAVVATPVPAVEGLIRDGENGVLVAPGDAGALARALARLAADPGLRDRLGAAAAATAREQLSWEAHLDGLERAYARARAPGP